MHIIFTECELLFMLCVFKLRGTNVEKIPKDALVLRPFVYEMPLSHWYNYHSRSKTQCVAFVKGSEWSAEGDWLLFQDISLLEVGDSCILQQIPG